MIGLMLTAAGFLVAICALALVSIEQEEPRTLAQSRDSRISAYDAWEFGDGT